MQLKNSAKRLTQTGRPPSTRLKIQKNVTIGDVKNEVFYSSRCGIERDLSTFVTQISRKFTPVMAPALKLALVDPL